MLCILCLERNILWSNGLCCGISLNRYLRLVLRKIAYAWQNGALYLYIFYLWKIYLIIGKGGIEVEGYHQLAEGMIKLHLYNLVFVLADDGWSIILSLEHQKVGRQVFFSLYGFHRYRELLLGCQGFAYISLIRSIGDDVGRRNLTLPQHWGSRSPLFAVLRHLYIIILQRWSVLSGTQNTDAEVLQFRWCHG